MSLVVVSDSFPSRQFEGNVILLDDCGEFAMVIRMAVELPCPVPDCTVDNVQWKTIKLEYSQAKDMLQMHIDAVHPIQQ